MAATDEAQEGYKCPECGNIQIDSTDCFGCSYGADEEGWDTITVINDPEEGWIEA